VPAQQSSTWLNQVSQPPTWLAYVCVLWVVVRRPMLHRVACSDEWCGKPGRQDTDENKKKKKNTSKKKKKRTQQEKEAAAGRYSQLLFLRSSPAAVLDPLLHPQQQQGEQEEQEEQEQQEVVVVDGLIEGQDAALGTTALEFEAFVMRERAVKTGRAPPL
jgi:hypothetical protein